MEIIGNKALRFNADNPSRVVEFIPKSKIVGDDVLVHWGLDECMVLKNMGVSGIPSPINKDYKWHGIFKPFAHQKETAAFLTLHKRAYCLNEMGCVDSETEYLSPTGWVKISEYTGGEVAQYHPDSRGIEFVEPLEYIKKPCTQMIRFKTARGVDQLLSPEHRMVIHDKTSKEGKWAVQSAGGMYAKYQAKKSGVRLPRSKANVGVSHAAIPATYKYKWDWGFGIHLTDAQIRLQVAVIADGCFNKNNDSLTCVISVKKGRKVNRLIGLLAEAGVEYSVKQTRDGYHKFRFTAPRRCKYFDEYFWLCTPNQIRVVYTEVMHWDGCFREGARFGEFSTTSKESADFIQAVFNTNGHVASIREDKREGKYRGGVCYSVIVRQQSDGLLHISGNNTKTESVYPELSTDGFKYCFSVPSTFLLFRRNGCVFASGNTGKTSSVLWAADYLMDKGYVKRVLIVCPLSIMHSAWKADAFKTIMHRSVGIAHGTRDVREAVIRGHSEIVVINYDGICSVMDAIERAEFDLIVIDEYNHYKNAQTRRWKAMNKLVKADTWLWGLTGSPASQLPTDAYGLAKLMNPSSVPKYYNAFRDDVMLKVTQFKYVPRQNAMDMVFKVLQPAIRFTKEECLDLPPRMYITREVPMSAQQKKYYKLLKEQMIIEAAGEEVTTANAAVNLSKLMQIACISINTPVLSSSGWKPIQNISKDDLVWDGEEWVTCNGAVSKGVKPVEICYGVSMTLDHKVLTNNGWVKAEDILYGEPSNKLIRAEVRLPDSDSTKWDINSENKKSTMVMFMRLWQSGNKRKPVPSNKTSNHVKKLWVPSWERNSQDDKKESLLKLPQHDSPMPQSKRQGLSKLRSAGYICLRGVAKRIRIFLGRYEEHLQRGVNFRSDRREWPLYAFELPMGDNQGTGQQHKKKRNTTNTDWKHDNKSGSGKIWHKVRDSTSAFASWMASKLSFNNTTRQRQETFDLLDCGPRNRFVVLGSEGPLIVHNCGAVYSDNKEVIEFDCSSRQEALLDIIEEASKKVIVFATFRHSIAMLEDLMNRNNIPVGVIHGQVSLSKRSALVEEFQSTPEPRVLILQPRSASHGITLTAANVVVWWTPTPSVETYLQANDRVHRAGQDAPCTVIHLCGSPVEERFYKTLEHKGNLLDDLLGLYKDVLTL